MTRSDTEGLLREALALADSMIRSGERHSPTSLAMFRAAFDATPTDPSGLDVEARSEPPERFDRSWWHYADDCPVSPRAIQESRAGEPDTDPVGLGEKVESLRYSEPLSRHTPEHAMWERNEETVDYVRAAIQESRAGGGLDVELPDESWCDCDREPVYGIKADRHLPSCRYGVVLDYLDIRDPRAYAKDTGSS